MKHPTMLLILIAVLLVLPSCKTVTPLADHNLRLSWDAPTTREDGTPLVPEEITGYEVWHDVTESMLGAQLLVTVTAENTSETVTLPGGTHCFYLITVTTGSENYRSAAGETVCQTVTDPSNPLAPTNLIIEIMNAARARQARQGR